MPNRLTNTSDSAIVGELLKRKVSRLGARQYRASFDFAQDFPSTPLRAGFAGSDAR